MLPETTAKMKRAPRRAIEEKIPQWLILCQDHKACRKCVKALEKKLANRSPLDYVAEE
jgi:hypothetical protein